MTDAARTLAELAAEPEAVENLEPGELAEVLAQLERLRARVWTRLVRPPEPKSNSRPDPNPGADRLLTVEELAERLAVSPDWIYRRSDSLPFAVKLSDRTLRFSERGLERWLKTRP